LRDVSPLYWHRRLIVALFNFARAEEQQAREAANGSSIVSRYPANGYGDGSPDARA
jgi:hypothetical protein